MHAADLILRHARELIACAGPAPRRGAALALDPVPDGALAAVQGRIVFAGPTSALAAHVTPAPGASVVDIPEATIVPGFSSAIQAPGRV